MIKILFEKLTSMLFEPIAVFGILGVIIAYYRSNRIWRKIIIAFVLYAILLVACFYQFFLISSRYASLALFPAIFFAVYFCFRWVYVFQETRWGRGFCRRGKQIGYLSLLVLTAACLGKSFHFNLYGGYIPEMTTASAAEINSVDQNNIQIYAEKEFERVAYYLKRDVIALPQFQTLTENQRIEWFRERMVLRQYPQPICYYFLLERTNTSPITQDRLGVSLAFGKWSEVMRRFTSSKEKVSFVLYKWVPSNFYMGEINDDIPNKVTDGNLCINGDFEQLEDEEKALKQKKGFIERGFDFYADDDVFFPKNWTFWFPQRATLEAYPRITLTNNSPIEGEYSLRCSNALFLTPICSPLYYAQDDYLVSAVARNESKDTSADVAFYMYVYNDDKYVHTASIATFELKPGKTYLLREYIRKDKMRGNRFNLALLVRGDDVLLDQIEMTSEDMH